MSTNMNRRSFVEGGIVAAGMAAVAGLAGCSQSNGGTSAQVKAQGQQAEAYPKGFEASDWEASAAEFQPVGDVADEKTYDIVVVGAGTAGMPAVLTALEEGATVCCLQKEATGISQGNGSTGIILDASTNYGVQRWIQGHREASSYRANRALEEFFAYHSGETAMWIANTGNKVGYPARLTLDERIELADGSYVTTVTNFFGKKPENNGNFVRAMCDWAAANGADIFYETPGVQLVQDGSGAVTGVIGKDADGNYIRFNATKAVIMATGDFQNNDSMVDRMAADISRFSRKQFGKTGDGILMAVQAGADMCHIGSAGKQVHDSDAGPDDMTPIPFLAVNEKGERFMNEELPMESWNETLLFNDQADAGKFCRIFDNTYFAHAEEWGYFPADEETLTKYIPGAVENPVGVIEDLIDTHKADTLDELAADLGIPADALKATVARYNELCKAGSDEDFGKQKKFMVPVATPPFWGIHQWARVSALGCGFKVNGNYQAVNADGEVIPGLYGAGFCAGDLCGDIDWSTFMGGMSCGSCFTSGRYSVIHALTGDLVPSHPADWESFRVEFLGQEPASAAQGGSSIRLDS